VHVQACGAGATRPSFAQRFVPLQRRSGGRYTMKNETSEPVLSAVFVDYDNVYLSLKRKNEECARRFAKESYRWIEAIASGALITPANSFCGSIDRRLVMNRCYGNPVPRRNTSDNATDMNSFAFVRHHFLRSGFEVIDCPPLTSQLKNSSDIRMVMDIRDFLDHKTNFDEFIILSSDADFTPVLHRLRAHAKRTVIFTNDNTVAPYTALSDGEVREADLIAHLMGEQIASEARAVLPKGDDIARLREQIIDLVSQMVLEADQPVPLEVLAERATRVLGHEHTVGTHWAGVGSFREFLTAHLPESIKLTDDPPYLAFETARALPSRPLPMTGLQLEQHGFDEVAAAQISETHGTRHSAPALQSNDIGHSALNTAQIAGDHAASQLPQPSLGEQTAASEKTNAGLANLEHSNAGRTEGSTSSDLQESISRIHAACEAPPFSPPEYRAIFSILEKEIRENQLQGVKTLQNVSSHAAEIGIKTSQDEARYVLDAVTEGDPWLDQGTSATLFAKRFRNHVVRRCKEYGLNLSASELDLIDAWFAATPKSDHEVRSTSQQPSAAVSGDGAQPATSHAALPAQRQAPAAADFAHAQTKPGQQGGPDWWRSGHDSNSSGAHQGAALAESQSQVVAGAENHVVQSGSHQSGPHTRSQSATSDQEEFPRIVRNRLRG